MGRWLSTALLVIALAVAALLIVPSFVDWNAFRPQVEAQASRLVGRPVKIGGDIGLRLLPSPDLILGDLTVADPADPKAPLLVAGRLEATADWLPLLFGEIRLIRLRLVEPYVRLTLRADGTTNWSARAGTAETITVPSDSAARLSPAAASRGLVGAISLRDVLVEKGTFVRLDERIAARDQFDVINGALRFTSAAGPWEGDATFQLGKEAMGVRYAVDLVQPKLPGKARLELLFGAGTGSLELDGDALGLAEAAAAYDTAPVTFKGKLELVAQEAAPIAKGLVALAALGTPNAGRQSAAHWDRFRSLQAGIVGEAALTPRAFTLKGEAALGKTRGRLEATRSRDGRNLALTARADLVYLDEMVDVTGGGTARIGVLSALRGPLLMLSGCACEGKVRLTAPKMILADATLSDGEIAIALTPGGARLETAKAVLPGATVLSLAGDLPRQSASEQRLFDGRLDFASAEPRVLLAWLGAPPERLGPALKTLSLVGPLSLIDRTRTDGGLKGASGQTYVAPRLDDAELRLGEDVFKLTAALDERPPRAITFRLSGEKLDADAFGLAGLWWPARPLDGRAWGGTLWGRAAASASVDLGLDLETLIISGRTIKGLAMTARRESEGPGALDLEIADAGGYAVRLTGTREAAAPEEAPVMAAALSVKGTGAGAGTSLTLPLAGQPLPGGIDLDVTLKQDKDGALYALVGRLGPMTLGGEGTGRASAELLPDIDRLTVSGRMKEGTAILAGTFRGLSSDPRLDGNLTIDAVDFVRYANALGYVYKPRRQDLGALSFVASLAASGAAFDLTNFAVSVGQQTAEGSLTTALGGTRPRIVADIRGGKIDLDGFLQAPEGKGTWSTDRMDTELLGRFDGTLALVADGIDIGPYEMRALKGDLTLEGGRLSSERIAATLFDGVLAFKGSATATEKGVLTAFEVNLENADLGAAGRRLFPALDLAGRGRASLSGSAEGRSLFGLVSTLSGRGRIAVGGGRLDLADLEGWAEGLGAVQSPESFLRLAKTRLGGGTVDVRAIALDVAAANGVLAIEEGRIETPVGTVTLSGTLKLPARTMAVRTDLGVKAAEGLPPAGLVFAGAIDAPRRYYDLSALQGAMLKRFEAAGAGRIREEDLPPDLRELLKEAPTTTP